MCIFWLLPLLLLEFCVLKTSFWSLLENQPPRQWFNQHCSIHTISVLYAIGFAVNWPLLRMNKIYSTSVCESANQKLYQAIPFQLGLLNSELRSQRGPNIFVHSGVLQPLLGDSRAPWGQRTPHLTCSALPRGPRLHSGVRGNTREKRRGVVRTTPPHLLTYRSEPQQLSDEERGGLTASQSELRLENQTRWLLLCGSYRNTCKSIKDSEYVAYAMLNRLQIWWVRKDLTRKQPAAGPLW